MTASTPQLGIGILYNPMLTELLQNEPELIDFLEIIPDSFWTVNKQTTPRRYLEHDTFTEPVEILAGRVPVVLHSVDLSIGSSDLFDLEHVAQIARWQNRFQSPWHSDHLSFSRIGVSGHDQNTALAIPVPYDEELLELISGRVRQVQSIVPAPFLLENNVYFFDLPDQEMSEPEFLNRLCHDTGCGLLLDIHNVYANARNHGFDPREFVSQIDPEIIVELHIAGGDEFMGMYTDSHAGPVAEPVWENLEHALTHAPGVRAVTYEFHESYYRQLKGEGVRAQLHRAREIWSRHH
ncbi:MAG: DUF692 domain-containing protein [Verrucomicrobiota bacterium]